MNYHWTLSYPPQALSFSASSSDDLVIMTRAEYLSFLEAVLPSGVGRGL